jgi:hypothetical protein
MRRFAKALILFAVLVGSAGVGLGVPAVQASVAYESPYSFGQTFGTALRLIRIDLGCPITEKDAENGYLLFEYTSPESGSRIHRGSVEVVRGKQGSHVVVQLPTLPQYHEQMIVDALAKKLAAEHGAPPPPPPPPSAMPVAPGDAGSDPP